MWKTKETSKTQQLILIYIQKLILISTKLPSNRLEAFNRGRTTELHSNLGGSIQSKQDQILNSMLYLAFNTIPLYIWNTLQTTQGTRHLKITWIICQGKFRGSCRKFKGYKNCWKGKKVAISLISQDRLFILSSCSYHIDKARVWNALLLCATWNSFQHSSYF